MNKEKVLKIEHKLTQLKINFQTIQTTKQKVLKTENKLPNNKTKSIKN